jgi:tRNA-binding protein
MEQITFEYWKKLELKVGRIVTVDRIPNTEKLYKLQVNIGLDRTIQIVSSLVPYYSSEELEGSSIIVLVNLKPTRFHGELSEGMLLAAEKEDGSTCILLKPEREIEPGTPIT